jgi:hypothetical protein
MNRRAAAVAITCGGILLGGAAQAQTADDLKAELAAKNAYISKLERRIRQLESQKARAAQPPGPAPTVITPIGGGPPVVPSAPAGVAVAPPPVAVPRAVAAAASPEDEEMERALERTLVREGALVLPPWTFQATPQFSYAHWDKIQDPFISNSYSAALSVAMGLPWTSQIAVTVPYVWDQGRDGNPSSSGFADVGVLLSKELLVENGPIPNLVGSAGWTSPTSRNSATGPIPYVSGFQAGFTASKRFDPLVVFLTGSYFSAAEVAGLEFNPANVVGGRMGASLAISPATAITAGFNVAYLTGTNSADLVLPNSDRLLSSVDVGFNTLVWNRTMLSITTQFGITGHTPDFRVITALPIRF